METKHVYVKTRAEFGKQCIFDMYGPKMEAEILPKASDMNNYIMRSHCHANVQYSKQLAMHEVQTVSKTTKNSGMFHFEGGWPRDINPRDEESTTRFRRRVEKDDNWAPKLQDLFQVMEHTVLQNGTVNIHENYFDDIIPTSSVQSFGFRTVNVYTDPDTPKRPVTNISWSPDCASKIVVSYSFLDFGRLPDYSKKLYIWQVDNPNKPYMGLEPRTPCVCCEFNPRDPSVLVSGLMTGQVCNWDIRTGNRPVQSSHLQFSHRESANAVKWVPTKSNSEFFSSSTDGCAMWWDTRWLREPTEILMFDLEYPNDPDMDRSIGVSCVNFGPMVGTNFMFGLENGQVLTGSRKMRTNSEKLAVRFETHFGSVRSVDRNIFNPSIFLTVGDWRARIWAEDTREGSLVSTPYRSSISGPTSISNLQVLKIVDPFTSLSPRVIYLFVNSFLMEYPTSGCWNQVRHSVFYVTTALGRLLVWDILQTLRQPVFTLQLCEEKLTSLAPCEEGAAVAIGTYGGKQKRNPNAIQANFFSYPDNLEWAGKKYVPFRQYLERSSKLTKAVDLRLREIKLTHKITGKDESEEPSKEKARVTRRDPSKIKMKGQDSKLKDRDRMPKEKKRVREDDPEILDAEAKYFEAVQKELEKYARDDPVVIPMASPAPRKSDKKRRQSQAASVYEGEKAEKVAKKSAAKEEMRSRKSVRRISETKKQLSLQEIATQRSKQSMRDLRDTVAVSSKKPKTRKKRRKKKRKEIRFVLPVPCKGEICRPKVCCWRSGGRERWRERSSIVRRSSMKDGSTASIKSATSDWKFDKKARRLLEEMRKPPTELTEDAARAKAEIKIAATMPRGTKKRRHVVRWSTDIRKLRPLKARGKIGPIYEGPGKFEGKEEEEEDSRTQIASLMKRPGRRRIALDPCSPPQAKGVVELYTAILGVSPPEEIEERIVGRHYLEAYQRIRKRIFPRISEYGYIE
ncbi:Dynein intermediate chain 3, ciliary [Eufriesea mexicana]|uniref:Dynein intermediate chain 3, ciliary n=1 Tax=Eufriesea mexicana TaxID=516756 RepID=A0A310SJ65_9HYME|nr:Dynein intermediate chain 3, ciliary [Eufriesea mexicana]